MKGQKKKPKTLNTESRYHTAISPLSIYPRELEKKMKDRKEERKKERRGERGGGEGGGFFWKG